MASIVNEQRPPTRIEKFRRRRRRRVKRFGKNFIRGLNGFISRQSKVDDLPVLDAAVFPFLKPLEDNWEVIRDELNSILKHRDKIPAFHKLSPDQKRISTGDKWQTFALYGFGTKAEQNCSHCPETTRLLEQVPNMRTAFFSILSPHYHIKAHRGVTKTLLRCHLGLIVPKEKGACRMRVDDVTFEWNEGKAIVLDDTFDHEVWNDSSEDRVVLLFDFDRPMGLFGRLLNRIFISGLKLTAYYRDPAKNLERLEKSFNDALAGDK